MWKSSGIEINEVDFYGEQHMNAPSAFKYSIGDRLQISSLVDYVKTTYDENGIEFAGAHHFLPDPPKKKKCEKPSDKRLAHFSNNTKQHASLSVDIQTDDFKQTLIIKIADLYKQCGIDAYLYDTLTTEMISMKCDNQGKVQADLTCVLCDNSHKVNRFVISTKQTLSSSKGKPYWVLSNYKKHVESHVKKLKESASDSLAQVTDLQSESDDNNRMLDPDENQSIGPMDEISLNNISDSDDELIMYSKDDDDDDDIIDKSVEIIQCFLEAPKSHDELESIIYKQISAQVMQMRDTSLKNNEYERNMNFMVENKIYTLKAAAIDGDNSCLFRTVDHQLNKTKLNTRTQNLATTRLRNEVVDHIKEHRTSFEIELKGTVYDRYEREGKKCLDIKKACDDFINRELSKSNCWGGSESIKAIIRMYSVNVLVFKKKICYFFNDFDVRLGKTIILAYCSFDDRKSTERNESKDTFDGQTHNQNHYNSVVYIEPNDIFDLSKYLATTRTVKRLKKNDS